MSLEHPIDRLLQIMARLRDPKTGCPWDLEQSFATIAPYTIEEAYEVADAIERKDMPELKDELGDLLFQVVFHARMAEEAGNFTFDDVVATICDKMVRRHPHIFSGAEHRALEEQTLAWEAQKAAERAVKAKGPVRTLAGVTPALPAITRAVKLTARAARVGFDWDKIDDVIAKLHEELAELRVEIDRHDREKIHEEMGDLLFVCANLARKLDVDPEACLRTANAKFERRFAYIEDELIRQGQSPKEASLETMEHLWNAAKRTERDL
jgi:ATP diphosphatase